MLSECVFVWYMYILSVECLYCNFLSLHNVLYVTVGVACMKLYEVEMLEQEFIISICSMYMHYKLLIEVVHEILKWWN